MLEKSVLSEGAKRRATTGPKAPRKKEGRVIQQIFTSFHLDFNTGKFPLDFS